MSELTTPIRIDIPGVGSIESADLYLKSEADKVIAEKDAEIARLKDELDAANNQCENLINSATDIMLRQDKVNDTKCAEIESLKASHYAEIVDAGMRERRLRRALWIARAERARTEQCYENYSFYIHRHQKTMYGGTYRPYIAWLEKWIEVERKCRAKAEEYK